MIKGVAVLSIGQALNQLLTLIGYVYLARLYEVADFGELALVLAIGSLIGGVSTLQYELTVLLPKSQLQASLASASTVLTVLFVNAFYAFLLCLCVLLGLLKLVDAFAVLVVSFATAMFSLASSTLNREERYIALASINIIRTVAGLVTAIIFALIASVGNGLVLAHAAASILIILILMPLITRRKQMVFIICNPKRYVYWLKRHKSFAIHTTPAAFFNYLAGSAPVFLLTAFFGDREVGLYSMLQRVVMGPVGIVAGAVNRVFQRELTKRIYSRQNVSSFFEGLSMKLVMLGFAGGGVLAVASYCSVMEFIFGNKWVELDDIAMLFIPVCIAAFFSSSLAGFAVVGENRIGMIFQLARLLTVGVAFFVGYYFGGDFYLVIVLMGAALTVMFVIQWLAMAQIVRAKDLANPYELGGNK